MRRLFFATLLLVLGTSAPGLVAHELRPAFLELREISDNEYAVTFKVPARGELRLALYPQLPVSCKTIGEKVGTYQDAAIFERWQAHCAGGIAGQAIEVAGLRQSLTDVLARIEYLGGAVQTTRLTAEHPMFVASGAQSTAEVAATYLGLGFEHILLGVDHLVFILALMLLIRDRWMLVKTITAFTIAHSITLAGSTLGYLSLPQRPVEAAIALSIAFVAREVVKIRAGTLRTAELYPWLVAFAFGLLHGFGFAGALIEIGLPHRDVPAALLFFNIGVELGQLTFVAGMLLLAWLVHKLIALDGRRARVVAGYAIGILAATWLIFRLSTFA